MTTTNHAFLAKKIAIIGAGISGLSCATQLVKQGHRVTIFDKSKGVGGRMSTKKLPLGDCDHGAQYFTCNHPQFAAQIQTWLDAQVIAIWDVSPVVLGGPPMKSPAKQNETTTNRSEVEGSSSALATPQKNTIRYVGVPSMTAPAKHLNQQLKDQQVQVFTSHTISKLKRSPHQWMVTSQEHQDHPELFDTVIIAIPAEQALALIESHKPELSAICRTPMSPCFALIAQFNSSIHLNFEAAFINQGPLSWVCLNNHKPSRTGLETWLLHATADWSEQHLEADPLWVKEKMLEAFSGWVELNSGTKFDLAEAATTLHRWKYANLKNSRPIEDGFVWQEELQLGLCGDWLNGGKVQGAWLSGFELAQKIDSFK
jgi:renalase